MSDGFSVVELIGVSCLILFGLLSGSYISVGFNCIAEIWLVEKGDRVLYA